MNKEQEPANLSDELERPTLPLDPPGWPQDPDNPRPGRIGSARFGFNEESGSVNGLSSGFGFMEQSSSGPTLI